MRIAFVTSEYITEQNFDGGLANYLYRIAIALNRRGHQPVIFVAADHDEILEHNGIRVFRVKSRRKLLWLFYRTPLRAFLQPLKWLCDSWSIRRVLSKEHSQQNFDLVQFASYRATGFFRLRSIPAVVRVSSFQPLLRRYLGHTESSVGRFEDFLEWSAIKRADAVFGPSDLIARHVAEATSRPVAMIESPFIQESYAEEEQLLPLLLQQKRYLLYFGSINVLKGMLTIADVLVPLFDHYPDLYFAFAGKVDDYDGQPLDSYLRQRAGRHSERLLFLGRLQRPQLTPVIQNALGVVLPSRIDNLPNSCIEAMACGKIVIGTRGASFEQLIVDGQNGFLVDIDAPNQLMKAIEKLLGLDEQGRESISTVATSTIERLAPDAICGQLEEFYRNCLRSCQ